MALSSQSVAIDLTNGQSGKKDDKLTIPTKLLECVNYAFDDGGILSRRNGHTRLCDGQVVGGATVTAGDLLAAYRDELIQATKDAVYSFSPAKSKLVARGRASSVSVRKTPIIRNTATQANADSATDTVNGFSVHAWQDSRGGVRYSVIDEATGAPIVWDASLSATAVMPRVVLTPLYVRIAYVEGANLKTANILRTAPESIDSTVTHQTDVHATLKAFDAALADDDCLFFVYVTTAPALARFGADTSVTGTAIATALLNNVNAISICRTTDGHHSVWYSESTVGMRVLVDSSPRQTTTNLAGPVTADAGTNPGGANVLTSVEDTTANQTYALYLTGAGAPSTVCRASVATSAAVVLTSVEVMRHCRPTAALFKHGGAIYAPFVFDSTSGQCSVFVVALADRRVVAKALPLSGALTNELQVRLGSAQSLGGSVYGVTVLEQGRLEIQNGATVSTVGVARLAFGFDRADVMRPAVFADALQLPSACPSSYDGVSATETGFHVFPEYVEAIDNGAGNVDIGTRRYVATYEWTDAQGRRHQSPPSAVAPLAVVTAAKSVNIIVQTLTLTEKYDNSGLQLKAVARSNVKIAVWATIANGTTTFYRLGTIANNPLAASVTYVHNVADSSITSNEILYTVGGTLDYFAPPAHRVAWSHQSRLFVAGCEDKRDIFYSLPLAEGEGPAFYPDQRLRLGEDAREPTAGISFVGRNLIFTADRIAFTYGEGQNALGAGAGYAPLEWLSHDVGCTDARSLVEAPDGLWFKTRRGLRRLNADLSLGRNEDGTEAGSEMDDYVTQNVTGAVVVATKQRIVWTTSSGSALVWDYFWRQWSRFTGLEAAGAALFGTTFTRLTPAGLLFRESTGHQDHDAAAVASNIVASWRSAWLQFGGVQGFQRARWVYLLGDVEGAADSLTVTFMADFNEATATESIAFAAGVGRMQVRHKPTVQKMGAFQIYVSSTSSGKGASFANLALDVGVKRGNFKTAATSY